MWNKIEIRSKQNNNCVLVSFHMPLSRFISPTRGYTGTPAANSFFIRFELENRIRWQLFGYFYATCARSGWRGARFDRNHRLRAFSVVFLFGFCFLGDGWAHRVLLTDNSFIRGCWTDFVICIRGEPKICSYKLQEYMKKVGERQTQYQVLLIFVNQTIKKFPSLFCVRMLNCCIWISS